MQNGYAQNVTGPDFFPTENAGNILEKLVFVFFLEILSLVFSDFLLKGVY